MNSSYSFYRVEISKVTWHTLQRIQKENRGYSMRRNINLTLVSGEKIGKNILFNR